MTFITYKRLYKIWLSAVEAVITFLINNKKNDNINNNFVVLIKLYY